MKKILSILFSLFSVVGFAQTTAMDFTKTDCSGKNYNLFTELNAGKVVIMEFVMMDCTPCVVASNGIKSIEADFAVSNPGRVEVIATGFINSYSCTEMSDWKNTNGLTSHRLFTEGAEQLSYYGGMGMPTIVIAAGWSHKIHYLKQGFSPSDVTTIRNAINAALLAADVSAPAPVAFSAYPNPATNQITLDLPANTTILISDLAGKTVLSSTYAAAGKYDLALQLGSGIYVLNVNTENGVSSTQKLLVK